MKNLFDDPVRKTNILAKVSFVAGMASLLPYLPAFILFFLLGYSFIGVFGSHLEFQALRTDTSFGRILVQISEFIPVTYYPLGGVLFGVISLNVGKRAIKNNNGEGDFNKSRWMIVAGKVFSVLGILVNIIILPIVFVALFSQ